MIVSNKVIKWRKWNIYQQAQFTVQKITKTDMKELSDPCPLELIPLFVVLSNDRWTAAVCSPNKPWFITAPLKLYLPIQIHNCGTLPIWKLTRILCLATIYTKFSSQSKIHLYYNPGLLRKETLETQCHLNVQSRFFYDPPAARRCHWH